MKVTLKNIIVPSIPLSVLLILSCVGLWVASDFGAQLAAAHSTQSTVVDSMLSFLSLSALLSSLISLGLTMLNVFLLSQVNNRFTIIRSRTFLPTIIFLILMSSLSETHLSNGSNLALTIVLLSLFYFFRMARDRNASEQAFMGSFLISLGSIIINPLIFIIPVCWIGFMMFQSFSLRTFLASIFGAVAPWIIFTAGEAILLGKIDIGNIFILNPVLEFNPAIIPLQGAIYFGTLLAIFIVCTIGMFSLSNSDAIHTRNKLNFMLLLIISLIILTVIFRSQFSSFLPIIVLIFSLLVSHPLTLKQNNFYGIIFLIFCAINIAYIISKFIFI
ncbi:MAG: hypothetical protein PHR83_03110 [Paludibacter sp.]|nr:hypothetical protein [Paludibacter sp.]